MERKIRSLEVFYEIDPTYAESRSEPCIRQATCKRLPTRNQTDSMAAFAASKAAVEKLLAPALASPLYPFLPSEFQSKTHNPLDTRRMHCEMNGRDNSCRGTDQGLQLLQQVLRCASRRVGVLVGTPWDRGSSRPVIVRPLLGETVTKRFVHDRECPSPSI